MMRSIPFATKNLLIINIILFLATVVYGGSELAGETQYRLNDLLGLHFFLAPDFRIYQLFTYMFMHGSFQHLFFNMFALWMFGGIVEETFGRNKFIFFYFVCGIGAGLFQEAAQFGEFYFAVKNQLPDFSFSDIAKVAHNSGNVLNLWTTVGASGAVYGILLAFGMLYPEQRIFIFPIPVPIKAKWFVMIYAGIELFYAMSGTNSNVAHLAHLGGMVFGFILIKYWQKHPASAARVDDVMNLFGNIGKKHFTNSNTRPPHQGTSSSTHHTNVDWDYNAKQKQEQKEVDAILDKIRRNGYDSLTKEEKQRLFEQGKK